MSERERHQVRNVFGEIVAVHERKGPWHPAGVKPKEIPLFGTERIQGWPKEEPILRREMATRRSPVLLPHYSLRLPNRWRVSGE